MLNGCDDGDLVPEIINFEEIDPVNCDNTYVLIYKLKEQESLLLQVKAETFAPEEGPAIVGTEEYDITENGDYKLVYKSYDGVISKSNICDAIRPSFPNVSTEWFAKTGLMEVITTPNVTEPAADGSTKIAGFNHSIYMTNVTYSKPEGDQVGPEFFFGVLTTSTYTSPTVSFAATTARQCSQTQIYNWNSDSSIIIDALDPTLIQNIETTDPRTSTISSTQNKVTYTKYKTASITADYFCKTPRPTTPEIEETWNALAGGVIEVETTKLDNTTYKHVITLKNIELKNGSLQFKLASTFIFGEITTQQ